MNVQIIYTSLTGCTRKLAQAIYEAIPDTNKSIHDLADGIPELTGDIILFGYWAMGGAPCKEMQELMKRVKGKAVGVFCTLAYYADSQHAFDTMKSGLNIMKNENQLIGGYVCNGALGAELKKGFTPGQTPTDLDQMRWEMMDSHPTKAECALGAERMCERIRFYERAQKLGIQFRSVE